MLTHPYLMATFAYTATSSPIHRGVFLSRSVLGRSLRPPPEAVAPLAADLHPGPDHPPARRAPDQPESCQSCHGMINPLGFALEHFDAIGRYRDEEKGRPIDATGCLRDPRRRTRQVRRRRELAAFLAGSEETHAAFVQQLFHYLVKQPIRAFGRTELTDLRGSFAENGFNIRKLMVEIMTSSALRAASEAVNVVAAGSGSRLRRSRRSSDANRILCDDRHPEHDMARTTAADASSSATWGSARRPCRSS